MKTNEKDILLIEDFLDGNLDDEQLQAFNHKIQSDPGFARLLEARKKLNVAYREALEYEALKNQVGSIIKKENRKILGIQPVWAISLAATVLILVGLFIVFQLSDRKSISPQNQMAESDSIEMLSLDEPVNYATKDYVKTKILEPVDGKVYQAADSILLRWETDREDESDLIILSEPEKILLIKKRILLSDKTYSLDQGILPAGSFTWYVGDTTSKGSFEIVK